MSILEVQAGGIGNVGCLQKDLYNYDTEKCKAWRGHDANILLEHFEREKNKNVMFTYTFDTDDEMCVTRCFWADAICRANHDQFGDVIIFDSTYNTNKYSLVFTPFCGVNNHGQTTLFACAFLSDESAESFIWLFEEFKKAMAGKSPKMIITDQDLGMTKAILHCFPQTFHRYCIWHITNKFPEKLATTVYVKTKLAFDDCIWNSHSTLEFEGNWSHIIEQNGLSDHEWLRTLYDMRSRWVPVFCNKFFSAKMTSSQCVEGNHAFFKRFEIGLAKLRHVELQEIHVNLTQTPKLRTNLPMEKEVAQICTRAKFYAFQTELWQSQQYDVQVERESDSEYVFSVWRLEASGSRPREIIYDKRRAFGSCCCLRFECEGITCRHLLVMFNWFRMKSFLMEYIINRWTKASTLARDVKVGGSYNNNMVTTRYELQQLAGRAIEESLTHPTKEKLLRDNLEDSITQMESLMLVSGEDNVGEGVTRPEKQTTKRLTPLTTLSISLSQSFSSPFLSFSPSLSSNSETSQHKPISTRQGKTRSMNCALSCSLFTSRSSLQNPKVLGFCNLFLFNHLLDISQIHKFSMQFV